MKEEKILNKRIFGFVFGFLLTFFFALFWFLIDMKPIGIICVVLSFLQIVMLLFTPKCYVFSDECLIIKYFFGLKEYIPWNSVRAITGELEEPAKYFFLESYRIFYYSQEKRCPFMQGIVSKNKATTFLLKKYFGDKF